MKKYGFIITMVLILVVSLGVRALVLPDDFMVIEPVQEGYKASIIEMGTEITAPTPQLVLDAAVMQIREYKSSGNQQIIEIDKQIADLQAKKAAIEEAQNTEYKAYLLLDVVDKENTREKDNLWNMIRVLSEKTSFETEYGVDVTSVALFPAKRPNISDKWVNWGWTFGTFK